eukprot:GHVN01088942.1.p1 GENE.GHVN01088942.1~~GHVN01088942.1.p1  ORF type:complete len:840 (+),score=193.37 GHVN01088942.1:664-3183(+)
MVGLCSPAMSREVGAAVVTNPKAVLFDMDGVLADVSLSYREAARATGRYFVLKEVHTSLTSASDLQACMEGLIHLTRTSEGDESARRLESQIVRALNEKETAVARNRKLVEIFSDISHEAISAAKLRGNANNDWDLTHSLIQDRIRTLIACKLITETRDRGDGATPITVEDFNSYFTSAAVCEPVWSEVKEVFQCFYLGDELSDMKIQTSMKEGWESGEIIIKGCCGAGMRETERLIISKKRLERLRYTSPTGPTSPTSSNPPTPSSPSSSSNRPSASPSVHNSSVMPMAVVTGRPHEEAVWFLKRHGLEHLFDAVIGMEDVSKPKPSGQGCLKAIEQLGVSGSGWVIMIGDTPDDIQAATSASRDLCDGDDSPSITILPIGVLAPPRSGSQQKKSDAFAMADAMYRQGAVFVGVNAGILGLLGEVDIGEEDEEMMRPIETVNEIGDRKKGTERIEGQPRSLTIEPFINETSSQQPQSHPIRMFDHDPVLTASPPRSPPGLTGIGTLSHPKPPPPLPTSSTQKQPSVDIGRSPHPCGVKEIVDQSGSSRQDGNATSNEFRVTAQAAIGVKPELNRGAAVTSASQITKNQFSVERRKWSLSRVTKETSVEAHICVDSDTLMPYTERRPSLELTELEWPLDKSLNSVSVSTGIGFFDHMIDQLGRHGQFGIVLTCRGDLHVDDHHTVEDCALTLGACFDKALGERRGVQRFGMAICPLDEALVRVVVDLSGRGQAVVDLDFGNRDMIGNLATENVRHFFHSFAKELRATIHVDVIRGENVHHKIEAAFKALAVALRQAVARPQLFSAMLAISTHHHHPNPTAEILGGQLNGLDVPSTKGVL